MEFGFLKSGFSPLVRSLGWKGRVRPEVTPAFLTPPRSQTRANPPSQPGVPANISCPLHLTGKGLETHLGHMGREQEQRGASSTAGF